jgi:hypothetical protein
MPDSSSSESKETITAHHAQDPTEVETPELDTRTQRSILIESLDGDNQPIQDKRITQELF